MKEQYDMLIVIEKVMYLERAQYFLSFLNDQMN